MELHNTRFTTEEVKFLQKWLGKIVDRGDLVEEIVEDGEDVIADNLHAYLNTFMFKEDS